MELSRNESIKIKSHNANQPLNTSTPTSASMGPNESSNLITSLNNLSLKDKEIKKSDEKKTDTNTESSSNEAKNVSSSSSSILNFFTSSKSKPDNQHTVANTLNRSSKKSKSKRNSSLTNMDKHSSLACLELGTYFVSECESAEHYHNESSVEAPSSSILDMPSKIAVSTENAGEELTDSNNNLKSKKRLTQVASTKRKRPSKTFKPTSKFSKKISSTSSSSTLTLVKYKSKLTKQPSVALSTASSKKQLTDQQNIQNLVTCLSEKLIDTNEEEDYDDNSSSKLDYSLRTISNGNQTNDNSINSVSLNSNQDNLDALSPQNSDLLLNKDPNNFKKGLISKISRKFSNFSSIHKKVNLKHGKNEKTSSSNLNSSGNYYLSLLNNNTNSGSLDVSTKSDSSTSSYMLMSSSLANTSNTSSGNNKNFMDQLLGSPSYESIKNEILMQPPPTIKNISYTGSSRVEQNIWIENDNVSLQTGVPIIVDKCISYIEECGLDSEGVYRIPGHKQYTDALFDDLLNRQKDVELKLYNSSQINVNIVATVIKEYFRHLHEPIIGGSQNLKYYIDLSREYFQTPATKNDSTKTDITNNKHIIFTNIKSSLPSSINAKNLKPNLISGPISDMNVSSSSSSSTDKDLQLKPASIVNNLNEKQQVIELTRVIREKFLKLNRVNYLTLRALFLHLNVVASHSNKNNMDSNNLAICWWPTILRPNFVGLSETENLRKTLQPLIKFMIDNAKIIFQKS